MRVSALRNDDSEFRSASGREPRPAPACLSDIVRRMRILTTFPNPPISAEVDSPVFRRVELTQSSRRVRYFPTAELWWLLISLHRLRLIAPNRRVHSSSWGFLHNFLWRFRSRGFCFAGASGAMRVAICFPCHCASFDECFEDRWFVWHPMLRAFRLSTRLNCLCSAK